MIRQIIKIDKEKCNGCGLCVKACHEGAIGMVDGKAQLMRDDYCDGLGDCLPSCPTGAISFEKREALEYNEEEVKRNMAAKTGGCPGSMAKAITRDNEKPAHTLPCGCPGSHSKAIVREESNSKSDCCSNSKVESDCENLPKAEAHRAVSRLRQWPVQIKLVPVNAPYFNGAHLLVSADCAAYAYGNFHSDFIKDKITLIGCPKLDNVDYSEKLTEILRHNDIKSVTAVRMEVPCCGGIQHSVANAIQNSGKAIPWRVVTISASGNIVNDSF